MATFIQLLVSGLATGAIYALIAVGFTLLWQTSQTINFAQGEFVMLPAFFILEAMYLGMPFWLADPDRHRAVGLLLGLVFKLVIVDPMLKHGVLPLVISTIALSLFMKEMREEFLQLAGAAVSVAGAVDRLHIFGAAISTQSLVVLARRHRHRGGAASLSAQDAGRPFDAGDRAKSGAGAYPRDIRSGGWCSTPS